MYVIMPDDVLMLSPSILFSLSPSPHSGSPSQIVFGIFIAVVYIKLYGYFAPYENDEDDFLQELAQYQVFITLFVALCVQSST
jgi:hypothetical protein